MLHLLVIVVGLLCFAASGFVGESLDPPVRGGRVVAVVGRMGSGKSLWLTSVALAAVLDGRRVACNYALRLPADVVGEIVPFRSWDELDVLRDCVVLLDEAHLWAPSWDSKALSMQHRRALSQLRKRGIDLYYATQHEGRVAKTLRELTTDLVTAQKVFGGLFLVRWYDPDETGVTQGQRKSAKALTWRLSFLDPEVAGMYQTLEGIFAPADLVVRESGAAGGAGDGES